MIKRKPHVLKINATSEKPRHIIFVDTETTYKHKKHDKIIEHTLRLGVAHYWRIRDDSKPDRHEWLYFKTADEFWNWCTAKVHRDEKIYLVSHNAAFDLQMLQVFEQLPKRGWKLIFAYEEQATRIFRFGLPTSKFAEFLSGEGKISDFKGQRWAATIVCLDNCNLFPGKLEEWGKQLNLEKLKMPKEDDNEETWFTYCQRDVEIMVELWRRWFDFLKQRDLGCFKVTLASQAFTAYRHRFMDHKIYIHTNEQALRLERAAYSGGRCEAFWVGERRGETFYQLDVNSMYPYVMMMNEYPTRLIDLRLPPTIDALQQALKKYAVIAEVVVKVDEPVFPIKHDAKMIYPMGVFNTVLSTPELCYALEHNAILEVKKLLTYRKRAIFTKFVSELYRWKVEYEQAGDRLHRQVVKLLLNAVYGKFAQVGYDEKMIGRCDPHLRKISYGVDAQTGERFRDLYCGGLITRLKRSGESFNSSPAIAAHVTAYARMYLWQLIKEAGYHHVYYVDTDSLIVDEVGFEKLKKYLDNARLGMLKLETTGDELYIRARKDYQISGKVKRKGIPGDAQANADGSFEVETWPGLMSQFAESKTDTFRNKVVTKHLAYTVDWGVKEPDGWVTPFEFGNAKYDLMPLLF